MPNQGPPLCRYAYAEDWHGVLLCGCKLLEDKTGKRQIADELCTLKDWETCKLNKGQIKDIRRYEPWLK